MSDYVASEVIAKYAVMGPRVEVERTLPLEPDETLIVGVIAHTAFGNPLFARGGRGFLRLTTKRLCIVRHYTFIRDRILVIPPQAITSVEGQGPAESVHITFREEGGSRVITVVNWRQPRSALDPEVLSRPDLDYTLKQVANAIAPAVRGAGAKTARQ